MKVLVTGDRGYIGSILVPLLIKKNFEVVGLDTGFFDENLLCDSFEDYEKITCDIRDIDNSHFRGVDFVIHLAGLSNDPLGELAPETTYSINHKATINLAKVAKSSGVSRFVYASSQSMYGVSTSNDELDEYNSQKNPVTAYADAKWLAEQELNNLIDDNFAVVSFRPSTVFGASPRLRTDIVFNNLVACAFTTGKIEIKSDGKPWRPIIHIKDVCNAFISGLEAPLELINGRSFNVGIKNGNYTVKQIAEAASKACPGSSLYFSGEHTDPRSYKVSFKRIHNELGAYFKPEWDLIKGGKELVQFFTEINFTENDFRSRSTVRLKQIKYLIENKKINYQLKKIIK